MMASMSVPCISPSLSTWVYRNSAQYGSSARTASTAVIGSTVFQPWMATCPPRLSTAAMTRSAPIAVGERPGEREIDRAVAKERRAGDDRVRAGGEHLARALDAANAAADPAGQPAADAA